MTQASCSVGAGGLARTVEPVADMTRSRDVACLASSGITDGLVTAMVAADSLKAGDSPRLRGEDLDHVTVLAEADVRWPPIVVHRQTMRVIDGMHRLRAARLLGQAMVEVVFFDGDEDEAFVVAVRANVAHGLPLTLADRKAAAARIIGSQSQRSDRWIGQLTGLSAGTVGAIRRQMAPQAREGSARVGRDGRVRPLEIAEGRRRAQEQIISRPDATLREIARTVGISQATVKDVRDRMRRGEDPVPNRGASRAAHAGHNDRLGIRRDDTQNSGSARDLAWLLRQLGRDPSVRYTESGRALLRWVEAHACSSSPVADLVALVPPHCGYLIADIARKCAGDWQELATAVEQRLHNASCEQQAALAGHPS